MDAVSRSEVSSWVWAWEWALFLAFTSRRDVSADGGSPESRHVDRDGTRIAFDVRGQGPAIVLLHSFLCDRSMWSAQAEALAASHRVVNVDMRGHGRSGPARPGVSLEDLVDDTVAVLDSLGIDTAVWAGLSIGGMIAMRGALRYPGRISALILVDTDAGAETLANRTKYRLMGLAARAFGLRPLAGPVSRLMFGATTHARRPELVERWKRSLVQVDVDSALAVLQALLRRESVIREVADIEVPCLVLVGAEDVSLPPDRSEQLTRSLRRASFRSIPRAGHLSAIERPDEVTGAMDAFLQERVENRS